MSRYFVRRGEAALVVLLTLTLNSSLAAEEIHPAPQGQGPLGLYGDLWMFAVHHDNPAYSNQLRSSFVETTARFGSHIDIGNDIDLNLRAVLGNVSGNSSDLIHIRTETETLLDLWNLEIGNLFNQPLAFTVGRQNFEFGDGFLVWDGAADQATIWTAEVRSMAGAKLQYRQSGVTATLFAARTVRDYFNLDTTLRPHFGKSRLRGAHIRINNDYWGLWELGLFSRDDDSLAGNDTLALSLRGVVQMPNTPNLEFAGELVRQTGDTRILAGIPATTTQDRNAWGGHLDATYTFNDRRFKPHLLYREVYFSGDDPTTADYEGYDPMFFGWKDWGTWYVASISTWEVFNTNTRVSVLEGGFHPTPTTSLRLQLFDFNLDREWVPGAGKQWSREANLIFDWYANPKRILGLAVNYAQPKQAAKSFVGNNDDRLEVIAWAILSF